MSNDLITPEEENFFGRVKSFSGFSTHRIAPPDRYIVISAILGCTVRLPKGSWLPTGGPIFYITNTNNVNTVTLQDWDGNNVNISGETTVPNNTTVVVYLMDSAASGTWLVETVANYAVVPVPDSGATLPMFFGGSADADAAREMNPYSDTWTTRTAGTNDHENGSGFCLRDTANRSYVCGHASSLKSDEYDPHAWTAKSDTPGVTSLHHSGGAGLATNGYLFGGYDNTTLQKSVQRYNGTTWTGMTSLSISRASCPAVGIESTGNCYIAGGSQFTDFDTSMRDLLIYSESGNSYTNAPAHPYNARAGGEMVYSFGSLFLVGGSNDTGDASASVDTVEQYTPSDRTWSRTNPDIPGGGVYGIGAVSLGMASNTVAPFIVSGGKTHGIGTPKDGTYLYDAGSKTWRTKLSVDAGTTGWGQQCSAPSM